MTKLTDEEIANITSDNAACVWPDRDKQHLLDHIQAQADEIERLTKLAITNKWIDLKESDND